jgi:hypothetical protein
MEEPINKNLAESKYKLPQMIEEPMTEKIIEDSRYINKMNEVLRIRGYLSSP